MLVYSTRKTPVGSHRDAQAAVYGGLDYLGDGLFKKVYVSPDGTTVYKVTRGSHGNDYAVSEGRAMALVSEAAWAAELKARKVPGIPPVSLWLINGQPVLSMPYYPKDSCELDYDRCQSAVRRWEREGLDDIHEYNFRGDARGVPKVIDLGGWGNDYPTDSLPSEVYQLCVADIDEPDEEDGYDNRCECCGGDEDYCDCNRCDDCERCLADDECRWDCECDDCVAMRDEEEGEDA
jgi:hypothetical protein